MVTDRRIGNTVCPIVQHFPGASIDREDDRIIFLVIRTIFPKAVTRRITFWPGVSCYAAPVVWLMHLYYLFVCFPLCLRVVLYFWRSGWVRMLFYVAVFTLFMTIFWSTCRGPAMVWFFSPRVRSARRFFDNISISFCNCQEILLWRLCKYSILVCNDGVGFSSTKRRNRRHEWARCHKFLRKHIGCYIGVEGFCYVSVQGLADDVFPR